MRIFFFLMVLMGTAPVSGQLLPVDLVCSSVADNGDVTLTWRPRYSTLDFARYEVYHSNSLTSPFQLIDQITDIAQVNYTHTGAAGQQQTGWYYIKTIAVTTATAVSDTIAVIFPEAFNYDQSRVELNWNSLLSNWPSSASGWFQIYAREESGPWVLLDSVQNTAFTDTVFVCNDRYYRIESHDQSCQSVSRIVEIEKDISQPETPIFDSVSVDAQGRIVLGWSPVPDPDTRGYIVFRQDAGIWDTLAVIDGSFTTSYTDLQSDPEAQSWRFCVAATDQCGNSSADMGIPRAQQSLYLFEPEFSICEDKIDLNWGPYSNMTGGLGSYEIWVSENNEPFYKLGQTSSSALSFTFTQPGDGIKYSFLIRARSLDGNRSASSPVKHLSVRKPVAPGFSYLRYASVTENRYISLRVHPDTASPVQGYRIERSENPEGTFNTIGFVLPDEAFQPYTDTGVNVTKKSYHYRITVIDSCGKEVIQSNVAGNILLENPTGTLLRWNSYESWSQGVFAYEVYRITSADSVLAATLGPDETSWEDPEFNPQEGADYLVKAIEAGGNPYGFGEFSLSNRITLDPQFKIQIPNAFMPFRSGKREFKPLMLAVDESDYYLAIFNRFGQRIFESQQPELGWDGTVNGSKCQTGVYVYLLRVLSLSGKYIEQRGVLVLLD